jgi:hypothetical protein
LILEDRSLDLLLGATSDYGTTGGEPAVVQSSRTGAIQRDYAAQNDYAIPSGGISYDAAGIGSSQRIQSAVPLVNPVVPLGPGGVPILRSGSLSASPAPPSTQSPRSLAAPISAASVPPSVVGIAIAIALAGGVVIVVLAMKRNRR